MIKQRINQILLEKVLWKKRQERLKAGLQTILKLKQLNKKENSRHSIPADVGYFVQPKSSGPSVDQLCLFEQCILRQLLLYNHCALHFKLKIMKKQTQLVRKQKSRGSEKFQFSIQNIGKRTGKPLKVYDTDDNYLRWSNTTENEDEFITAKQESSSSFSILQREKELNESRSSKSSHRSKSIKKHQTSNKLRTTKLVDEEHDEKEKDAILFDKNERHEAENKKEVEYKNKPDQSNNELYLNQIFQKLERQKEQYNKTKKQQEAKRLKQSQQANRIKQIQQAKRLKQSQQANRQNLIAKQHKKQAQNSTGQQLNRLRKQSKKEKKPDKKNHTKQPVKKQEVRKQIEIEDHQKQSQSIIKDHKKAKYKPESRPVQFEYILPQQLRNLGNQQLLNSEFQKQEEKTNNHLKRERPEEAHEEQEEEIKMRSKFNRPKQQLDKQSKNSIKDKRNLQESKKEILRTSEQETPDLQILRGQKQLQAKGSDQKREKVQTQMVQVKAKERRKIKVKQNLSSIENRRLKRRMADDNEEQDYRVVSQNIQVSANSHISRPRRTKTPPLKFYQNQRLVYNSKNQFVSAAMSTQKFMEVLGFESGQQINGNSVQYASNSVRHRICLKKGQILYSIGLNEQKLQLYLKNLCNFDKMWVSYYSNPAKEVKVKIDNHPAKVLDEQIYFQKDQTLQIKNCSDRRTYYIIIAIQRTSKSNR